MYQRTVVVFTGQHDSVAGPSPRLDRLGAGRHRADGSDRAGHEPSDHAVPVTHMMAWCWVSSRQETEGLLSSTRVRWSRTNQLT